MNERRRRSAGMFCAIHAAIVARPSTVRAMLAGPMAILASVAILAAMPVWFPAGAGGVDNLILPMLLFPAVWASLVFYAILGGSLARVGMLLLLLALTNGAIAIAAVNGWI